MSSNRGNRANDGKGGHARGFPGRGLYNKRVLADMLEDGRPRPHCFVCGHPVPPAALICDGCRPKPTISPGKVRL